jgi:hypothetical protein
MPGIPLNFDDAFLATLPPEPAPALLRVCERFRERVKDVKTASLFDRLQVFSEAYGALVTYSKRIKFSETHGALPDGPDEMITAVRNRFDSAEKFALKWMVNEAVAHHAERTSAWVPEEFAVELSQSDVERIQAHLNKMRDLVRQTAELEERHRQRIQSKLEALQQVVTQKMSNTERFGAVIIEMLTVGAKIGEAAKPLLTEMAEVSKLWWKAKRAAHGIPEGARLPQLPTGDGE